MQKIMLIGILAVVFGSFAYLFLSSDSSDDYQQKIQKARQEKDDFFRTSASSPLKDVDRANFKGLRYFEVDKRFRVEAQLERFRPDSTVAMGTTGGEKRYYQWFGKLTFRIGQQTYSLTAWLPTEKAIGRKTKLFVPFTDLTSGEETYGAGRYLDIDMPEQNTLVLDFNEAYLPYCAYNEEYICPLVPRDNHLSVKILAGETKF